MACGLSDESPAPVSGIEVGGTILWEAPPANIPPLLSPASLLLPCPLWPQAWGDLVASARSRGCLFAADAIPELQQVVKLCHLALKRLGLISSPGHSLFKDKPWEVRIVSQMDTTSRALCHCSGSAERCLCKRQQSPSHTRP